MGIGKRIGEILKDQGKSAAWLSRKTNIPATTIRTWINKDKDSISYNNLDSVASALNCAIGDLVESGSTLLAFYDWSSKRYQLLALLLELSHVSYDYDPIEHTYYLLVDKKKRLELTEPDESNLLDQTINYFEFEFNKLLKELESREDGKED